MKTVAVRPSSWAASATPCAWLPALAATTPRAFSSGDSRLIRVYAPRILKEPARCRFSHLRYTGPPTRSDSARLYSSGVGRTTPASTSRAARTSSSVTGNVVIDMAGVWHLAACSGTVDPAPADVVRCAGDARFGAAKAAAGDVRAPGQRDAGRMAPRRGRPRLPRAPPGRPAAARHGYRRRRPGDRGALPAGPPRPRHGAGRGRRPPGRRRPRGQLPPALRPLRRQPPAAGAPRARAAP